MNDFPRLYVHGVNAEAWARRYGMGIYDRPCSDCGVVLRTSRPFVQGALRGLQAPECACGNVRTPYVIVRDPAHGDLFTGTEPSRPRKGKKKRGPPCPVVPLRPRAVLR